MLSAPLALNGGAAKVEHACAAAISAPNLLREAHLFLLPAQSAQAGATQLQGLRVAARLAPLAARAAAPMSLAQKRKRSTSQERL